MIAKGDRRRQRKLHRLRRQYLPQSGLQEVSRSTVDSDGEIYLALFYRVEQQRFINAIFVQ
jgi:hypothetical protein